jgi:hypothetical protein
MRDSFRNFNQFKIDPLSEIRNAGIVTNGDVYWVSSTLDSDHTARTDALGRKEVRVSLQSAIDEVVSDQNDYVLVIPTDGGTARPLGTAVDVNEDRVHILGIGAKPAPMAYNGLTFQGYVAANGIDTELLNVTGAGVELGGLRFLGTSGTAAGGTITAQMRVGTAASGTPHDLWVHDFHVENTSAAADDGTAVIVQIIGDVAGGIQGLRFDRCWFGDWAWAPTGVVSVSGTAGPTRAEFRDCKFVMDAQATTDFFILCGTGVTNYNLFENCGFINVEAGTAPASALTGASLADNPVVMRNCYYVNTTQAGTDTEVYKTPSFSGTQAAMFDPGIASGTASIAAS